jgi:hypothetical protein
MSEAARRWTSHERPIGPLTLIGGPRGLSDLNLRGGEPDDRPGAGRPTLA